MPHRHRPFLLILSLVAARAAIAAPLAVYALPSGEGPPGLPASPRISLAFGALAGPVLGIEPALRGGEVGIDASLILPGGLGLGAGILLLVDRGMGAWICSPRLLLRLGGELGLSLGGESRPGGADPLPVRGAAGGQICLAPRPWPSRFSVEAVLGELVRRASAGGWRRLLVEAALSWSAYRIASTETAEGGSQPALATTFAGATAFSLGLRARLGLRLELGLGTGMRVGRNRESVQSP